MWRQLRERATAKDSAEPFINWDGYLSYTDHGKERFRELLASQQPSTPAVLVEMSRHY